jgi:hypothetical protein
MCFVAQLELLPLLASLVVRVNCIAWTATSHTDSDDHQQAYTATQSVRSCSVSQGLCLRLSEQLYIMEQCTMHDACKVGRAVF